MCGPDIRWCGNEAGDVRKSEWSVVPARTALAESVQERSQQTDDKEFRMRRSPATWKILEAEERLKVKRIDLVSGRSKYFYKTWMVLSSRRRRSGEKSGGADLYLYWGCWRKCNLFVKYSTYAKRASS